MGAWLHQRYNGGSISNTWPETAISESETLLAGGRRRTIIIMPTATKKWTASHQHCKRHHTVSRTAPIIQSSTSEREPPGLGQC